MRLSALVFIILVLVPSTLAVNVDRGWDPGLTKRMIATVDPQQEYFESCPDSGGCYPGIPAGGGFYAFSTDIGGNYFACGVNTGEVFDAPASGLQTCPFYFYWNQTPQGKLRGDIIVDTYQWTNSFTANVYDGFHDGAPYGNVYLGGNNLPTIDGVIFEADLMAIVLHNITTDPYAGVRFLTGISWYVPSLNKSFVMEMNLDHVNLLNADGTDRAPEWPINGMLNKWSCGENIECFYMGGRHWGFPEILDETKKVTINWTGIANSLVLQGFMPPEAIGPYQVGIHNGPELVGRMKATMQISNYKLTSPSRPSTGIFEAARSNNGNIRGWAYDPDHKSDQVVVHTYFDGPMGTGTFIFSNTTTQLRNDINSNYGLTGNHGFQMQIPVEYRDGTQHSVYIYAIDLDGGGFSLLQGSPKTFLINSSNNSNQTLPEMEINETNTTAQTNQTIINNTNTTQNVPPVVTTSPPAPRPSGEISIPNPVPNTPPPAANLPVADLPKISIIFSNETDFFGTVQVKTETEDANDILYVEFYKDNIFVQNDSVWPFEYEWDKNDDSNGVHTIYSRAVNSAGISATSEVLTFSVDNAPSKDIPQTFSAILFYMFIFAVAAVIVIYLLFKVVMRRQTL